ncbi:MAG TPA: helix-turn-helix domain-containing protein, partial [Bacteroidetes bacterium]|nr:helix-turn-helix domain-containing protein [Bacteroidota bacterium]
MENQIKDSVFQKKAERVLSTLAEEFQTTALLVNLEGTIISQKGPRYGQKYFCDRLMEARQCKEIEQSEYRTVVMEAWRWGEAYISRCDFGVIRISVPVLRDNKIIGGIILRPILLREPANLPEGILKKFFKPRTPFFNRLKKDYRAIPIWDEAKIYRAAHHLFELAESISTPDFKILRHIQNIQKQQAKIAEEIHLYKSVGKIENMRLLNLISYDIEKELIHRVRLRDRTGAKEILNKLLGIVLLKDPIRVDLLKAHILELVVIFTRAAVEEGGNLEDILGMKYNFIVELSDIQRQEEICYWIVRVLDRIIDNIYATRNANNYEILEKALHYIEKNSSLSLTLENVANHVALSPSHFSHLIKKELGFTFVDYLTRVRIQKAKSLLRQSNLNITQIAFEVGYPDQSYFTKVFKRVEKATPKLYRKSFVENLEEK